MSDARSLDPAHAVETGHMYLAVIPKSTGVTENLIMGVPSGGAGRKHVHGPDAAADDANVGLTMNPKQGPAALARIA